MWGEKRGLVFLFVKNNTFIGLKSKTKQTSKKIEKNHCSFGTTLNNVSVMYTSKCKTELTIVEPEALPGAVCDSDNNLKVFCTEAGGKYEKKKKKSILDSVTCQ